MKRADAARSWQDASRRRLEEGLNGLHGRLVGQESAPAPAPDPGAPSALERLCACFALTAFERDLLLLCVGYELDERFGRVLGQTAGASGRAHPTLALASQLLGDGHWSAVAAGGVLREGRLLRVDPGPGLAASPLRVEEAVLDDLTGQPRLDRRLRCLLDPLPGPQPDGLLPSQRREVSRLLAAWRDLAPEELRPVVQLVGSEVSTRRQIVAAAAAEIGFDAFALDARLLPVDPLANDELLALWRRDAVLHGFLLVIETGDETDHDWRLAGRWLECVPGLAVVSGPMILETLQRPLVRQELAPLRAVEQVEVWRSSLGDLAASFDGRLGELAQQFPLSPKTVAEIAAEARGLASGGGRDLPDAVWDLARLRARGGLDSLAQRIEPRAGWDDLVLPPVQKETLRTLATHVRRRTRVYEDWGFAHKSGRGLGIGALFSGPSGTGKTMAAEVLAGHLGLDLFRIDLSATVSKYIGETEKNLARIFAAAERSGAILLFDEADAIFGKRSEVRHGQDRYANLEVSYLLQRIEAYRGLAILTTNLERNVDPAFVRRLRFVIKFPFPGASQREEIWRRIFPDDTPTATLDFSRLAELSVAGGHIRNIALAAAFQAADRDGPITMNDLAAAAVAELAKGGQNVGESRLRGWCS